MKLYWSGLLLAYLSWTVTSQATPPPTPSPTTTSVKPSEASISPTPTPLTALKLYNVSLTSGRIVSEGKVVLSGEESPDYFIYGPTLSYSDAKVICRSLGYSEGGIPRNTPFFGSHTTPHRLLNLVCSGQETSLMDCNHTMTHTPMKGVDGYPVGGVVCKTNKSDIYPYGYPAIKRNQPDGWSNAVYIMHPADRMPHSGYVRAWHFYPTKVGVLYLQIWRRTSSLESSRGFRSPPIFSRSHYYFLVGQTKIVVTTAMLNSHVLVKLNDTTKIPFDVRDVMGMYFPDNSILPFSKKRYCSSYSRTLYTQRPANLVPLKKLYFRQKSYGWSPCRIYSIYATVNNKIVPPEERVTLPKPVTTPLPTIPPSIKARLVSGRTPYEGLVQVSKADEGDWGYVCDDGWDNKEAMVVCRSLGYAGGVSVYQPFFGQGTGNIHLDDLVCSGNETSLADCTTPRGWMKHNCRHREDAGVECIPPNNKVNDTLVFGYPAVNRMYEDTTVRGQAYILDPSDGFPFSGTFIYEWNVFLKYTDPVYLQVYRFHQQEHTPHDVQGTYLLVNQTEVGQGEISNVSISDFHALGPIKSGDVLGIYFPKKNPVPYDNRMRCRPNNRGLYLEGMTGDMTVGKAYTFQKRTSMYSPCKIFSVYAKYYTTPHFEMTEFTYGASSYYVATDIYMPHSYDAVSAWCSDTLNVGTNGMWKALMIETVGEMNAVNNALNTIPSNTTINYWINVNMQDSKTYTRWGYCEPSSGKHCTVLSNYHHGSGSYRGFDFHMYNKDCEEPAYVICENDQTPSTSKSPSPQKTTKLQDKKTTLSPTAKTKGHKDGDKPETAHSNSGMITGVIVSLLIVTAVIGVIAFLWYRRKNMMKYDEARVRFMHLDQNDQKL